MGALNAVIGGFNTLPKEEAGMTDPDLRPDDVVDDWGMIGPKGLYHVAVCETCSTRYYAYDPPQEGDEYRLIRRRKSRRQAMDCCHDAEVLLDGEQ